MTTETDEMQAPDEEYKWGFSKPENYVFKSRKGLSHEIVAEISEMKGEAQWMRDFRHKSLDIFLAKPMPTWGGDLSTIDFGDIYYYIKPTEEAGRTWDDLPTEIRDTFNALGIPQAEQKYLAGVGAQYESEVIYHKVREDLEKQGVIFVDPNTAFREHEELFRPYFATVIPPNDNKFAALNSAVWSGGSFIYIPKGVRVEIPLQAYFRINAKNMGQFERTLIIADEDSYVHYVEGCFTAGARVRTLDGEKLIEDIREGDEVFTHKGRHRRVYHTMQRPYKGTLYNVRFFGDSWRELHITEEHPLLVTRRQKAEYRNETYKPEWLPVSEVKPGDYLMIPVPQPEKPTDVGHTITIPLGRGRHEPIQREVTLPLDEDFFRLVGYYHAEGHVDNEHYLSFSFHVEETELLDDTRDLIERYFAKAPIENKPRQNGQTLVLSSTEAARAFARTFGSTVYDKRVPDFIRNAPKTHLAQWVRGVWLGDGSYDTRKNMFRYNSVSQELAYAFRDALLRLGVAASVNMQERKSPRRPMYVVVISSPWNEQFGEIVGYPAPGGAKEGSPFALDEQYLYVPIRSIEIEEVDTTVYNFSVEEDESYVAEGVISHNCTAPTYTTDSLHSAVVEIIVRKNARVRYTTIQNWSKNVYNLVTKRAMAYENATMEWVDGNLGCKLTMKYPAVWLMEPHARGEVLSVAFAGDGQHQDAGGKVVHVAPHTSSQIVSKSISKGHGRSSYRGLLKVHKGAHRRALERALRRAAAGRDEPHRHLPLHRDRGGGCRGRPRGDGLEGRRGAALLPDEPWAERERGLHDDRQRLHRADRQGVAAGVRRRAEPADPTGDVRLGRLGRGWHSEVSFGRGGARCSAHSMDDRTANVGG